MTAIFDKLNLRPHERRFVFAVGMLIFLVLNWLFIWPRFGEWRELLKRKDTALATATRFQAEIAHTPKYQARLDELAQEGMVVPTDLQDLELATTIQSEAAQANVFIPSMKPAGTSGRVNNPFFDETRYNIQFTAGEKELVTFLVNLS